MGKRKERRLAALSNAGRRVKLDLFAEPSEDLGGPSSVNEEVEEEADAIQHSGLLNSPASSGKRSQNPLLLLEQYSDDELDEESSRSPNHAVTENSPSDHSDQVGSPSEGKEVNVDAVKGLSAKQVEDHISEGDASPVLHSAEGGNCGEDDVTVSANQPDEADSKLQISVNGLSNAKVVGDVHSGWRIVMHEESSQYYYWNIETGETSWEMPDSLAQVSAALSNQAVPATEILENVSAVVNKPSSTLGSGLDSSSASILIHGPVYTDLIPQSQAVQDEGHQVEEQLNGSRSESEDKNCITDSNQNESQYTLSAADVLVDNAVAGNEVEKGLDFSADLIRQCESLLERLKSIEGYASQLQFHDRVSKYVLEVNIRLSDIKALSSYGQSLLPFWEHSQRHLRQLEDNINSEIYHLAVSSQIDDTVEASTKMDKKGEDSGKDSVVDGYRNDSKSEVADISTDDKNASDDDPLQEILNDGNNYAGSPSRQLGQSAEVNGTTHLDPSVPPEEDVDMDVDMDVEDGEIIVSSAVALSTKQQQSLPNEPTIPPLPEEDWVPPPPPESDQIPPPPPDEPPESSYPPVPSVTETGQALPYTEHYSLSYPGSSFQYFGHSVTVPSSNNLYGHSDGSQTYYDVASAPPVIVSAVEPVAYYTYQNESIPSFSVDNVVTSSHLHTSSSFVTSDQMKVTDGEAARNSKLDGVTAAADGAENVSICPANSASIAEAVSTKSAAAKVQAKAMRSKKRTIAAPSMMRSNKKVSSLVDKWKAAKEELNETEEDEPENALEILERKRQREIEEWHAKQIASGEAKDNANFQPLGGDWREKVKRRRAQAAKESAKDEKAQAAKESEKDEKQPPDLTKLSKGLPSNWQAYWDEASKQVYYGNVVTSETTWIKPTK